jgi:hypothetical protein
MSTPLTNIRVFVQWSEQTVFAGEDIECQITFKNIANTPTQSRASLHPQAANGLVHGERADKQRKIPLPQRKSNPAISSRGTSTTRGHRTTLSLNAPVIAAGPPPTTNSWTTTTSNATKSGHNHKRSVSIISMGPGDAATADVSNRVNSAERPRGPSKGHGRSASLQIVPRRNGINGGPPSGNYDV